ncbi:unnamed protein product [Adineta ricciae]|uniref:PLD phosphodiesterase domain-containing protein n=2 Tax=Adineta ricciae TaxID=249248 RepID=A0A816DLI1_ADIRI|nr:unnamed protein product [Adineta ricciae]
MEMNDHHGEDRSPIDNIPTSTVTSLYTNGYPLIKSPSDVIKSHFSNGFCHRLQYKFKSKLDPFEIITKKELDIAAEFGRFPYRPSNLFLKIFYNVIRTLEYDPLGGRVSPSLIGSSGIIPLTIISTIPDIMRHYYQVIVNAQKEILFATMYWERSESANVIRRAFQDLDKRANAEHRHVIIKLMIDRPNITNTVQYHSILRPTKWSDYDLPAPDEIPNISLEVHNYHHFIMGTFHSKFLIVDRRVVLLNSNNIQDRPNLEMMSQYEGEIVNSFYDTFLISWSIPFQPNLVCLNDNPLIEQSHFEYLENEIPLQRFPFDHINPTNNKQNSSSLVDRIFDFHKSSTSSHEKLSNEQIEKLTSEFTPFICHRSHQPFPIVLVNRSPHGTPMHRNKTNPQNAAWISAFRFAEKSIFIQTPTFNASPAIEGIVDACRRGIKVTLWLGWGFNDLKEGRGTFQGGTNKQVVKKLYKKLKKIPNGIENNLEVFWYVAKDQMRPIHFSEKKRNCHIKFMSIDDQVAIMGNANMDSFSWFHSQEINTMIDSPLIVQDWINGLYKNQSTNIYGKLNNDGKWCENNQQQSLVDSH